MPIVPLNKKAQSQSPEVAQAQCKKQAKKLKKVTTREFMMA
jgi:hypothetical protein